MRRQTADADLMTMRLLHGDRAAETEIINRLAQHTPPRLWPIFTCILMIGFAAILHVVAR